MPCWAEQQDALLKAAARCEVPNGRWQLGEARLVPRDAWMRTRKNAASSPSRPILTLPIVPMQRRAFILPFGGTAAERFHRNARHLCALGTEMTEHAARVRAASLCCQRAAKASAWVRFWRARDRTGYPTIRTSYAKAHWWRALMTTRAVGS